MTRKSEEILILDETLYNKLVPLYLRALEELQSRYQVKEDKFFADLVNFKQNKTIPKHKWFIYKQGYAEELVKAIIEKENPSKDYYVLDPFSGVGTTNVVAQSMGYKSIGFDINPVAILASKVKTNFYSDDEITKIKTYLCNFSPVNSSNIPNTSLLPKSFKPEEIEQLIGIKGFYESIPEIKVSDFFKLGYLSIIEDCSNRVKDGNGIKIVDKKNKISDIYTHYTKIIQSMIDDLAVSNFQEEAMFSHTSITVDSSSLDGKKVGIVIFSPPYANCFDYCEVYKLELWLGNFVEEYSDFKQFRNIAIRSHVNSSFDHSIQNKNQNVETVSLLLSSLNLWNKNIPDMIKGYFDDMAKVFEEMSRVMITGSKAFIVVANSAYRGVLVPTDLLLAEIAETKGFKVLEINHARKIRASSQQMKGLNYQYGDLMRESIIILQKE